MHFDWPEPTEFPALSGDEVHAWAVPLDRGRESSTELEVVLSPSERERADGFALEKPRHAFMASRAALRTLLGRYLDLSPKLVPIVVDQNGKPRLAGGDLHFNLAHSAGLTLIGVTRGCEIGIDVEHVRPVDRVHEIAARNFHPAEQAAIRAATDDELPTVFMQLWTRKEAVLKAVGIGLGFPLDVFETVSPITTGGLVELPALASLPATRCWLRDVDPCRNYSAAVATLERRQPPMGFTYSL